MRRRRCINKNKDIKSSEQVLSASVSMMEAYANITIKSILTLNGGAAIALLAFLGTIVTTEYNKWTYNIGVALVIYAFGALFSSVSAGLSYLSQSNYYLANQGVQDFKRSNIFRKCAIWSVFFGVALFVIGTIYVAKSVLCS